MERFGLIFAKKWLKNKMAEKVLTTGLWLIIMEGVKGYTFH